jgi:hypothetical protein
VLFLVPSLQQHTHLSKYEEETRGGGVLPNRPRGGSGGGGGAASGGGVSNFGYRTCLKMLETCFGR